MVRFMASIKRIVTVDGVLLLANVAGALIYLMRARSGWVIPQEQQNGINVITGEPFVWALSVLPVCAVFLVLNTIWGGTIAVRRRWLQGRIWLLSALVWIVAIVIDFSHH
jgi:hypothetical protein